MTLKGLSCEPFYSFLKFGPNTTTRLMAARETFPTDVHSSYHGFCVCMGKLAAIATAMLFSYVSAQMILTIFAIWSFFGLVATIIWLPDTTRLDL